MRNFFATYGNEYDSYQSIRFSVDAGFVYLRKASLTGEKINLPSDLVAALHSIIDRLPRTGHVDSSIGQNPTPGERHFDTRNSIYFKLTDGNIEFKFLLDAPPMKELVDLSRILLQIIDFCESHVKY